MFIVALVTMLPFLVFCTIFFNTNGKTLYEGDSCSTIIGNTETPGKCQSAYDCPWALKKIQQRDHIDICSYKGRIPIICCVQEDIMDKENLASTIDTAVQETPDLNEQTLPIIMTKSNFGAVSKKKCIEYYPPPTEFGISAFGGEESLAEEFPHMAVLGYGSEQEKQWKCGGSLISKQHILTAAHCISSRELGDVKFVRIGDLDLSTDTDNVKPQDFVVKNIIPHPNYDPKTSKDDIAILELDKPVEVTNFVKPACLHWGNEIGPYDEITATGWGVTAFAGEPSNHLIKVHLRVIENGPCRNQYTKSGERGIIDELKQVCAGSANDENIMDTCQGDSGGPLQVINYTSARHYHLIGVTSFGKACGVTNSPGVYTRVSYYIPWIESIVFKE